MAKFRKKPVVIDATRWWKDGDHPNVLVTAVIEFGACARCDADRHYHGWVNTLEGGHTVCPGDWIITGVAGENYPCKPSIFDLTYEPVDP